MSNSYAVVLTHNRPELLQRCLEAIAPQVDKVIVVDNASSPPVALSRWIRPSNVQLVTDPSQPPNLSRMWNTQFDRIARMEKYAEQWDVAVLCDDAIAPPGWFTAARDGMRAADAAAASTHAIHAIEQPIIKTTPDGDLFNRMCGWAFMLAGEKGIRADEEMHWWYVDDDISFQARKAGGMVIVPGPVVPNEIPNGWTNAKQELGAQAGQDRAVFQAKWGMSW